MVTKIHYKNIICITLYSWWLTQISVSEFKSLKKYMYILHILINEKIKIKLYLNIYYGSNNSNLILNKLKNIIKMKDFLIFKMERIKILPNEVFINILYNIKNLKDLINIYDCFEIYRNLIHNEIKCYFKNKKHYFHIILNDIIKYLDIYISEKNNKIKYKFIIEIKKLYNKNYVYKLIIENHLKCNICNYIFSNNMSIYLYKCFICDNIICTYCNNKCYPCIPYSFEYYYHCPDCKNKSFKNIKEKIEKFNIINKEKNLNIKYVLYNLYKNYKNHKYIINIEKNKEDIKNLLILQYYFNYLMISK